MEESRSKQYRSVVRGLSLHIVIRKRPNGNWRAKRVRKKKQTMSRLNCLKVGVRREGKTDAGTRAGFFTY